VERTSSRTVADAVRKHLPSFPASVSDHGELVQCTPLPTDTLRMSSHGQVQKLLRLLFANPADGT
jgi:hypothetical protein